MYDVTDYYQLIDGDHLGNMAGQDLTQQMDVASHGEEVMERMRMVGVLAECWSFFYTNSLNVKQVPCDC